MRRFIAGHWPTLLGLLVALVIWRSPAGPVWRVETTEKLLGFSRDGRTVLTLAASKDGLKAASLQHRDIATGRLSNSVELGVGPVTFESDTRLSADRKTLLISTGSTRNSNESPTDYYFVDVTSGVPRAGPMEMSHINPDSFSTDGRWLWIYRELAASGTGYSVAIDILSVETGEVVNKLRADEYRYPWSCRFSEDGKWVAVLWRPKKKASGIASQVRLFGVTSDDEDRRFDLPDGKWQSIHRWDGHSMTLEFHVPDGDRGYYRRCRDVDLSSVPMSEGIERPLLSGYVVNVVDGTSHGQTWWEDGPGWLAYATVESTSLTNWQATLSRVDKVFGTQLLQMPGHSRLKVHRVDPVSGWTISELPNIPFGWQLHFSDDGRRLAVEARRCIELWDTLPPPCWPWAIGAGAVTAFGPVYFRRRFRGAPSGLPAGASSESVAESLG